MKKLICKRCSWYSCTEYSLRGHCMHPSCFDATGYDPVTGKEILKRFSNYENKNLNLDCPDFKKKWFLV